MTPRALIERLGFEILVGRECPLPMIGTPPTIRAGLVMDRGTLKIWVDSEEPWSLLAGVHEALHAIVGPSSLEDELSSGLMALEWAVCQHLDPNSYFLWRQDFSDYSLSDEAEVGSENDFLKSDDWMYCEDRARDAGFLQDDGSPVWDKGPHPEVHA